MTCTRCGARLEAERTTCGLCGHEQRAVTEISVPPYVDRSFSSFGIGGPEIAPPSITVEAPPAPPMHGPDGPANESGSRRRPWRIVIAAVLSVALVASGVAIVSLSGSLRSTKADLDAATDRSAQTAAQLDDAQERVVSWRATSSLPRARSETPRPTSPTRRTRSRRARTCSASVRRSAPGCPRRATGRRPRPC